MAHMMTCSVNQLVQLCSWHRSGTVPQKSGVTLLIKAMPNSQLSICPGPVKQWLQ